MLRQTLSELHIRLAILPQGPLLIKEGRHADKWELERSGVAVENRLAKADTPFFHRNVRRRGDTQAEQTDMTFVYSHTPHGDRYYLPGSSLRGVLRSAAEQVVGRWRPDLPAGRLRTPADPAAAPSCPPSSPRRRGRDTGSSCPTGSAGCPG